MIKAIHNLQRSIKKLKLEKAHEKKIHALLQGYLTELSTPPITLAEKKEEKKAELKEPEQKILALEPDARPSKPPRKITPDDLLRARLTYLQASTEEKEEEKKEETDQEKEPKPMIVFSKTFSPTPSSTLKPPRAALHPAKPNLTLKPAPGQTSKPQSRPQ